MSASSLELRPLCLADERSFRETLAEFRQEQPVFDFALGFTDVMSFPEYVDKNDRWSRGEDLPAGFVRADFLVGVVAGEIVGRLSLRHELNEFLATVGGHIGYGVRPSQRQRGYATAMLQQALPRAARLGITHALITCDVTNTGSIRVIERCGGVLESVTNDPALTIQRRRYWIATR